jgi:hypothetical protein
LTVPLSHSVDCESGYDWIFFSGTLGTKRGLNKTIGIAIYDPCGWAPSGMTRIQ